MNRRAALSRVSILLGGTIIGAEAFLSGCRPAGARNGLFTQQDIELLDEIADTIIPATADSPGAKAARTGTFMQSIVTDCYHPEEQQAFTDGIRSLQASCEKKYKKSFDTLSSAEREAFLTLLHEEARAYTATPAYKQQQEAFDRQQDEHIALQAARHNFGAAYQKKRFPPHYFTMMRELTLWGYFSSKEGMTQALRYVETPGRYDGDFPYQKGDKAWAL